MILNFKKCIKKIVISVCVFCLALFSSAQLHVSARVGSRGSHSRSSSSNGRHYVSSHTRKTKSGKTVHVKAHTAKNPKPHHTKSHARKTKSGKIVNVKAHHNGEKLDSVQSTAIEQSKLYPNKEQLDSVQSSTMEQSLCTEKVS